MTRDLVDEAIAAGCLEWVPDALRVRALPEPFPAVPATTAESVPLTVMHVPYGEIVTTAICSDRAELERYVNEYLAQYDAWAYGTRAEPIVREIDHWSVRIVRRASCE